MTLGMFFGAMALILFVGCGNYACGVFRFGATESVWWNRAANAIDLIAIVVVTVTFLWSRRP